MMKRASSPIATTLLLALFLILGEISPGSCRHVKREAVEKSDLGSSETEDNALSLRGISLLWGKLGSQLIPRISEAEEKIGRLYSVSMASKAECEWMEEDRKKWERRRREIKVRVENGTDLHDSFGLEEFRVKKDLNEVAQWTLGILEDMENLTRAFVVSDNSDISVLKYAGYLRERMILRQRRIPSCTWTDHDRRRAEKKIEKIIDQLATEVINGLVEKLEEKPGNVLSEADKESIKQDFDSLKEVYGTLFEPFEED